MLRFYCPCGKRLKVDDSMVGRIVECPQCQTKLEVPAADGATDARDEMQQAEAGDPGLADLVSAVKGGGGSRPASGGARQAAAANGRRAGPARRGGLPSAMTAQKGPGLHSSSNLTVIGFVIALGVLVVAGLAAWALSGSSSPPPPAPVEVGKPMIRPAVNSGPPPGELWPQKKFEDPTKPSAPAPTTTPAAATAPSPSPAPSAGATGAAPE